MINIYFAYFVDINLYIPSKREIHHQWTRTYMLCKTSNAVEYYFFCLAQYQSYVQTCVCTLMIVIMPPGTIVPMGAYCFYCVRAYVRTYVRTYGHVRTYVRVWLKFLVKVLYWFKLYLMPSKHFRWTVYMFNFDIKINLDEFYF